MGAPSFHAFFQRETKPVALMGAALALAAISMGLADRHYHRWIKVSFASLCGADQVLGASIF